MKIILTAFTLAVVALLCGCANLGRMMLPEQDTALLNAESTAKSAETVVNSFLAYAKANYNTTDLDQKNAARGLENFDEELRDLRTLAEMYQKYRSGPNLSRLSAQIETVRMQRDIAATQFVSPLSQRGQGAPFAPPLGSMPPALPQHPQTIVVDQAQVIAELQRLRGAVAQIGMMLHTNLQGSVTLTNPPPPVPK